jgi:hypothetical protein
MDSDTENFIKSDPRENNYHASSSNVGISTMVSTITQPVDRTSDSSSVSKDFFPHTSSPTSSFLQSKMDDIRVQSLRSRFKTKGFSEKAIRLLESSLDPNSSRTMSSNLKMWISWFKTRSVDPVVCFIADICDFLVDKHNEGLAFNTIAGYRTAISKIHEFVNGSPIGIHPDISQTMQSIHAQNPPPVHSDDPIDIIPSLDYIKDLGDNTSMSIRDLFIKTSFLLALVTACRQSDLKRIDLTTLRRTSTSITLSCVHPKEYKIARSHSLSTSKSPVKQIYISIYIENPLLCPYMSLSSLFSRTETWRISNEQKRSIFLITREPHSLAATDTIASYIDENPRSVSEQFSFPS